MYYSVVLSEDNGYKLQENAASYSCLAPLILLCFLYARTSQETGMQESKQDKIIMEQEQGFL